MTDPVQEQLLGYLLGALDDAEMEQVRARLEREEPYQRAWATLRRQLKELDAVQTKFAHPPGLAERTCRFIFARSKPSPLPAQRRREISPLAAPASWASRFNWLDMTVSLAVFVVAGLLILPAIQTSRFSSRLATCRDNMRELGTALAGYSQANQGYLPSVPTQGNLAAAGIYAPTLLQGGFLTDARRVVCPDSPLAEQGNFRMPTLAELQAADAQQAAVLRQQMGGSYGYCIGYMDNGVLHATKNLGRSNFAIMADAPREERPDRQSADHGGRGQNVLFEDGHVDFLTSSQPSGWSDDIFANDRNQVAAGVHRDDSVIVSSGVAPIVYVKGDR